jgi:hypothetical protein
MILFSAVSLYPPKATNVGFAGFVYCGLCSTISTRSATQRFASGGSGSLAEPYDALGWAKLVQSNDFILLRFRKAYPVRCATRIAIEMNETVESRKLDSIF